MSSIASISPASSQSASTDNATSSLGLPPVGLAQAASTNTVNAELVVSGLGVDSAAVAGVFGGSAASGSNWFSNVELLPALSGLSHATAQQALSLFGIQTPTVGSGSDAAATDTADAAGTTGAALSPTSNSAIAPSDNVGAAVVDPLWGKNA